MRHEIEDWGQVQLSDLLYAFRKAKADNFFEKSLRLAEVFIEYESDLANNLNQLLGRVQAGEVEEVLYSGLGEPAFMPKVLTATESDFTLSAEEAHGFFSDAEREFDRLASSSKLTPEFRIIGDFPVETHVLSALWINLVGHKFDALLSPNALGSRLRRYRSRNGQPIGDYHREAIGSFQPYFNPYRRWRDEGLNLIRDRLSEDDAVIAVTLDFSNFYHRIDPSFFRHEAFQASIGVELNKLQKEFTTAFSNALAQWSEQARITMIGYGCDPNQIRTGGLPIGLSIVRVISNIVLHMFDESVRGELMPLYYARYVDDIFLVIQDPGSIKSTTDLWTYLFDRLKMLKRLKGTNKAIVRLPAYFEQTELSFHPTKQKTFFLKGQGGLDLLNNIASEIRNVASERRLMPLPDQLEQSAAAKVLSATRSSADEADSLRRADGLSVRRLGWSVLLRSVEILARDLHPRDWKEQRRRFYEFAHDHVIRPDKILGQIDYLPRLLSLAVAMGDWKEAATLLGNTFAAIYKLQEATAGAHARINGFDAKGRHDSIWDRVRDRIIHAYREAVIRSLPLEQGDITARPALSVLKQLLLPRASAMKLALQARESDWGRIPYKEHIRVKAKRWRPPVPNEQDLYGIYVNEAVLLEFLDQSARQALTSNCPRICAALEPPTGEMLHSRLPYLAPTRPYTAEEIALYLPSECVFGEPVEAAHLWAEYTRAVRGIWVRSHLADEEEALGDDEPPDHSASPPVPPAGSSGLPAPVGEPWVASIGEGALSPVYLGITSLGTKETSWSLGAAGTPDLSPARYGRIAKLINDAIKAQPRAPTHLLLPELSLPEQWIATVSGMLADSGISLIAGLDYRTYGANEINSSAVLVLMDDRLGYPSALQIRQTKQAAAPDEERELLRSHGRHWRGNPHQQKPIYIHNGFCFSVLVCSELQNVTYRLDLQGMIDSLMILSWNKDLETFSALVDAASFDVHAYIALVNNREYGDSRVRAPAKASHLRDVCRLRGGLNDHLVVVKIDAANLRAQQSRAKRWTTPADHYKPTPEGFQISPLRRTVPS